MRKDKPGFSPFTADATEQIPIISNATTLGVDAIMISNDAGDIDATLNPADSS